MRVRFSFLSTSICFSLSFLTLCTLLPLPRTTPFSRRYLPLRSLRPFVSTIDVLVVSYSFLIFRRFCVPSLSVSLSPFLLAVYPSRSFQSKRGKKRRKEKKKKTAATMASCIPVYGTLNLSVRVHQINLHSLVDRINVLLTSTRFLSANED